MPTSIHNLNTRHGGCAIYEARIPQDSEGITTNKSSEYLVGTPLHQGTAGLCSWSGRSNGDAAHAMLPHQGAGAGQCLEDAWLVARLLRDPQVLTSKPTEVFTAYDSIRRPRACCIQLPSQQAGELYYSVIPLWQIASRC